MQASQAWAVIVRTQGQNSGKGCPMIDTLKVFTDDFRISDNAGLFVQPATVNYETGETKEYNLFRKDNGAWVTGAKAYVNTGDYQLTIKPIVGNGNGKVLLFLQTSLPKIVHGENYQALNNDETVQAIDAIADDLNNRGVGVNLQACKISRIDAFRMASANNPFTSYAPVFRLLSAKRSHTTDYGTTFTWANTQREICVYDKAVEMRNRGVKSSALPTNAIRFEYRLKTSRVCKKETGAGNVRELVNNLDNLQDVYRQALENSIFSLDAKALATVTANELENGLRVYFKRYGGAFVNRFFRDFGAYALGRLAGVETVKSVLSSVLDDRYGLWRHSKLFDEYRMNFEMARGDLGDSTLKDLYLELKEKILPDSSCETGDLMTV